MDIWLLATQLLLGDVAAPQQAARRTPPAVSAMAALPTESEDCLAVDGEALAVCAIAAPAPPAPTMAASSPQTASSTDQPPLSMQAVVRRWPSPEAIRTPVRPALPPLPLPSSLPASGGTKPVTGPQLYQFRTATLQTGQLYTQVSPQPYRDQWQRVANSPTHDQWQALLAQEAETMTHTQGQRSLTVVVGDSLGLWLPLDELPLGQLWLNQSISGETTTHMLRRLHYFAATRPRAIHIMAGINDLKNGATETQVVNNLDQIIDRLKQQHPRARLVVYSILPTRLRQLPSDRIQRVNRQLATLAEGQGATFVDLHPAFSDDQGQLRPELTTDGLHLTPQGYTLWRAALVSH